MLRSRRAPGSVHHALPERRPGHTSQHRSKSARRKVWVRLNLNVGGKFQRRLTLADPFPLLKMSYPALGLLVRVFSVPIIGLNRA